LFIALKRVWNIGFDGRMNITKTIHVDTVELCTTVKNFTKSARDQFG
jgi:hypothetical protein